MHYSKGTLYWLLDNVDKFDNTENPWEIYFDSVEEQLTSATVWSWEVYSFLVYEVGYPDNVTEIFNLKVNIPKLEQHGCNCKGLHGDTVKDAMDLGLDTVDILDCTQPLLPKGERMLFLSRTQYGGKRPNYNTLKCYQRDRRMYGV